MSGSISQFFNIGISKYINEEQKNASLSALQFITSKEVQKIFTMKKIIMSGIKDMF